MKPSWRRVADRLSIYLPVLLMGLLALGSWWLVRSAPQPVASGPEKAPVHEPDYFMKDFSIKSFDVTGRLKSQLEGSMARHYPDTDTLEIDDARMHTVAPDGRITNGRAKRALSNGDGSEVQLFGNAVVTRQAFTSAAGKALPQMQFEGEFLHAWPNEERVRSNQPVVLTRGADRFTADNLEYDNLDQVMQMKGRVRGVIQPAPSKAQ
ncbi:LPS export ABC transporter periplasmic protein LptC [Comamonas composti]|uniref:LPS export ABC transporter periplasmic protein LptC n=1 Tax=Comamonas composti TaxID=408558 RepID=UPI000406BB45|nr:LPS export ABC transporter periplasmic protein LptC [Comamonas composti]